MSEFNHKVLAGFLLCILSGVGLNAQEIKKIIPPSPTTAALAKYGDTPVSYYTGTPTISIPLYEIKTNDFSLPISLSYHASGVKVEEMASWVGLGWSLNAGGIISRSVRGEPDEGGGGYINPSYKVSQIIAWSVTDQEEYFRTLVNGPPGSTDLEGDMFYFNFGSVSGKYFYNQEAGSFICIPQKPIFIDKTYFTTTGNWKIKGEDGTEYLFTLKERNQNEMACGGSASPASYITTGWFLTKITTPVSKQEITFSYDAASYSTRNISSHTIKQGYLNGAVCLGPGLHEEICESTNSYQGYRLNSITFPTGRVEFRALISRADLLGDKRLDSVKIFNSRGDMLKKFGMSYDYFNNDELSSGQTALNISYLVRLRLNAITEIGSGGNKLPPYLFAYVGGTLPSRLSYSQDHWGYYNGASNANLVPSYRDVLGTLYGANRTPNSTYTKIGSLNRITYPLGGYTDFEFENHSTQGFIPHAFYDNYVEEGALLSVADACTGSPTGVFCKTFTVNDQSYSGADVYITIVEIPVAVCPPTSAAVMSISNSSTSFPYSVNCSNHIFLPNGTYTLTADFSAAPYSSIFDGFAISLRWKQYIASTPPSETVVGGLRIKKITDNDGLGNTKSKFFQYKDVNNRSSGTLVTPFPVYEYTMGCGGAGGDGGAILLRKSYSNVPMGTTSGSHIGYGRVSVFNDAAGLMGSTVYWFSNPADQPDIDNPGDYLVRNSNGNQSSFFPFPPTTSFDHRRGLLLKQEDYKTENSVSILVRKLENKYQPLDQITEQIDPMNPLHISALNIKCGKKGTQAGSYALSSLYETVTEWIKEVETTETWYENGIEKFKTVSKKDYQTTAHMQVTGTSTVASDGSETKTYLKYPLDYTGIPTTPTDLIVKGIKKLRDDHVIAPVIEQFTTRKIGSVETVVGGSITVFKDDAILPSEIFVLKGAAPKVLGSFVPSTISSGNFVKDNGYEQRLSFVKYDVQGNLLEQKKSNDITNSYLWGYDKEYPVAEIVNAKSEDVSYTSFEDDITNTSSMAVTGSKSHIGTFSVGIPGTAGSRKLTYWKKTGSTPWEYVETTISTTTTIGSSGNLIDEVRVYPLSAQIKTYTYKKGVGITSASDQNSVVQYYEYDSFARLRLIKDNAGNILKMYQYNYKGQLGSN